MESNKNYYNPHSPTSEPWDLHPKQLEMIRTFLRDNGNKPGFTLLDTEVKVLSNIIRANNYTFAERGVLNSIHMYYKNMVDSTFGMEPQHFEEMGYPSDEVEKIKNNRKETKDVFKKGVGGYILSYGK
jgi:hypothetical protein